MLKLDIDQEEPECLVSHDWLIGPRQELRKQLIYKRYPTINYQKLKVEWSAIERPFFKELGHFVPGVNKKIRNIIIIPTRFGTSCSFNVPKIFPADIYVFIRDDQTIFSIAEAVITAVTRFEAIKNLKANWEESELLVDWLVNKTILASILARGQSAEAFHGTIRATRSLQLGHLRRASEAFYRELGINPATNNFSITGEVINYGDRKVKNITKKEFDVLKTLIENKSDVVSLQEIGKVLYQEQISEKFSLWSIAKFMQRLRDKLEDQDIGSFRIQTVYGQGFTLKND